MRKFAYAAFSGAVLAAAMTSAASADVIWNVTGTFNDGGTLSGTFLINQYGYIDYNAGYDLVTTAGSILPGFTYTPSDSHWSNGTFYVDFHLYITCVRVAIRRFIACQILSPNEGCPVRLGRCKTSILHCWRGEPEKLAIHFCLRCGAG